MCLCISGGTLCRDNRHTINRNRLAVPEKSQLNGPNGQPRYSCLKLASFGSVKNNILGQINCFLFGCSSNMAHHCHLTWTSLLLSSTSIQNILKLDPVLINHRHSQPERMSKTYVDVEAKLKVKITYFAKIQRVEINRRLIGAVFFY